MREALEVRRSPDGEDFPQRDQEWEVVGVGGGSGGMWNMLVHRGHDDGTTGTGFGEAWSRRYFLGLDGEACRLYCVA